MMGAGVVQYCDLALNRGSCAQRRRVREGERCEVGVKAGALGGTHDGPWLWSEGGDWEHGGGERGSKTTDR